MSYRYLWLIASFSLILIMAVYLIVNPSYEKSFEAKYYYHMGDYKKSLSLSKEAFDLNVYNRMASTIMAQSQISLQYTQYIQQAKKYMKDIDSLAHKSTLSNADKAKMRLMSQIVVDGYIKLSPSVVTDKKLVEEAAHYHREFVKLYEKIDSSI
ncbi:hypothetical protein [Sulfurimonas sp. HSL-1716]|uniref:hypothetical protein n=1 Tax=Hydrocurvibacter sulfurireducens TaxID=3131937 RepID=UPI0031F9AD29